MSLNYFLFYRFISNKINYRKKADKKTAMQTFICLHLLQKIRYHGRKNTGT